MQRKFRAKFYGFTVDSELGLHFSNKKLPLHPKELRVLVLLLQHGNELVSKEQLAAQAWDGTSVSDERIARCISVIKSALRKASPDAAELIKNEYGRGYRFTGRISTSTAYICEEGFQALINASPDLIAIKDGEGHWLEINHTAATLYHLKKHALQGRTDVELASTLSPEHGARINNCKDSDEAAWEAGIPSRTQEIMPSPSNGDRILDIIKTPLFNEDGSRKLLTILGRDVTEQVHAQEQIKLANQALANSNEAVLITDANNNILSVNRAFTEVTGYESAEVIGKNPRILSSGRQSKEFYHALWHQIQTEGTWRGEIWDRRKSGEIYPKWLDISTVHNDEGKLTNYIAIFSDLSDRKATEAQLEFMAYHDALTKLPNRILLRDRFEQAVAASGRDETLVALLFLDLDQFKAVNDSLGHEVGDQLLLGVSDRISSCVRETDTVSRLGGDEFVILLTNLPDAGGASLVAQKVMDQLGRPFHLGQHILNTSFSIGISLFPDDGTDFDTLMKLADTAMYYAKDAGRNTYRFYTDQMNINAMERLNWLNNLHRALDHNEFVLHYQPQLDLKNGSLIGMEALIRWNSPEMGLVSPAKFIHVAEDSGLIVPIGKWVLQEACRQNRDWQDAGLAPVAVAVNLSALQFRRGSIVDTVTRILNETGLDPQWLELELTESILVHDIEQVLEIVRQLKKLGIKLAIDDFGTGYSSLTYLKRFAVDKLKIDQSFIRNVIVDTEDAAIVRSIIQLGHGLNLKTIAEGVETRGQADYLLKEGCDEVQGYLYGHPLPPEEALSLMQRFKIKTPSR